jgi:ABC-2 type transport system permease protein
MNLPVSCVAAMAICRRDALIYFSYPGRLLGHLLGAVLPIVSFYYISRFVALHTSQEPTEYFGYAMAGIITLSGAQGVIVVSLNLRSELLTGTFERLVCSPFGAVNSILASVIFPTLLQLCVSAISLGIASIIFEMRLSWHTVPLAVPVAIVGACIFGAFALLGAAAILLFKQSGTAITYLATGLGIFGGTYFPVALLPAWSHEIINVQPLTNLTSLIRYFLIGYPRHFSVIAPISCLVGALVVLGPAGYLFLHYAIRLARNHATLLEY